ncbi:Ribosomal protein L13 [Dillenia turbinata]|uniref:Ribosomal protein L13 n=1 Tax=Dillenia turbinata TaxID=194707 RepID=A0AAN8ZBG5_9MAGN
MTIACASSSMVSPCSSQKPKFSALKKIPFLGISVSSSASSSLAAKTPLTTKTLQISCKKEDKPAAVHIPLDQRWMFEHSQANGPDIWNMTWYPKAPDHVNTDKPWYFVDATDKILGRLASTIAIHIRGKNLASYTPSVDMGAFVIVVNAEKIAVSGKKRSQKLYRRHSGRPGGMKVETFDQLQHRIPERIIEHAVRGMLPKGRMLVGFVDTCVVVASLEVLLLTKVIMLVLLSVLNFDHFQLFMQLGRALFNHLKVYKGPDHPHEAQKPIELPIRDKRIQKER